MLSPWVVVILSAAVFSFYASARSLQIGEGVAVIAVTSVAANLSTILAGLAVFGDRLGDGPLEIAVRTGAFALILVGAALIPAPVRAGEAIEENAPDEPADRPVPAEPGYGAGVNPLGLASVPADVLSALRLLPLVADRLERVAANTDDLPPVRVAVEGVKRDTSVLPAVDENLEQVMAATDGLPEIGRKLDTLGADLAALGDLKEQMTVVADATGVLPGIDERMSTIEGAMPALLEVQQHLARLPETIEGMQAGIDRLTELMERLLTSMDRLDGDVDQLQQSIKPLGRIADRLPGGPKDWSRGVHDPGGNTAGGEGQLQRPHARGLHPRPVVAGEQLGQLGGAVRRSRLRPGRAHLARRPRDRRAGSRQPGRLRREDPGHGGRPHRRGDRGPGQEAGRDGALDRWPAGADHRRARAVRGHRGHRPRPVPRRAPRPPVGLEVGFARAQEAAGPQAGRHPDA